MQVIAVATDDDLAKEYNDIDDVPDAVPDSVPDPVPDPGPDPVPHSLPPSPLSDTNVEEDITVDDSVRETSNKAQPFKVRH